MLSPRICAREYKALKARVTTTPSIISPSIRSAAQETLADLKRRIEETKRKLGMQRRLVTFSAFSKNVHLGFFPYMDIR